LKQPSGTTEELRSQIAALTDTLKAQANPTPKVSDQLATQAIATRLVAKRLSAFRYRGLLNQSAGAGRG